MKRSCQNISSRPRARLVAAVILGLILMLGCGRAPATVPTPTAAPVAPAENQLATPTTISKPQPFPSSTPLTAPAVTSEGADLGVVYYLGYGWDVSGPPWNPIGGLGSQGWNEVKWDILWSGLVTTVPGIGFYASGDPATIETHLLLMESLGVDFVILPYQGWGDADLDGEIDHPSYIGIRVHDAAKLVLDTAKRLELDTRFAFMVEPFMEHFSGGNLEPEDVTDVQRQMILNQLWEEFYQPYSDLVYKIDGKPLVAAAERFSWGHYEDSQGRYEQRNIVWHHELAPFEDWSWVAASKPPSEVFADSTVFVWPRYDEWAIWLAHPPSMEGKSIESVLRMDQFLEEGAYDQGWEQILGRRSDVDRVIVWSWNSWADKVYIEPDRNEGYAAHGDLLTRKTAYYYRLLASGLPFEPMNPNWVPNK